MTKSLTMPTVTLSLLKTDQSEYANPVLVFSADDKGYTGSVKLTDVDKAAATIADLVLIVNKPKNEFLRMSNTDRAGLFSDGGMSNTYDVAFPDEMADTVGTGTFQIGVKDADGKIYMTSDTADFEVKNPTGNVRGGSFDRTIADIQADSQSQLDKLKDAVQTYLSTHDVGAEIKTQMQSIVDDAQAKVDAGMTTINGEHADALKALTGLQSKFDGIVTDAQSLLDNLTEKNTKADDNLTDLKQALTAAQSAKKTAEADSETMAKATATTVAAGETASKQADAAKQAADAAQAGAKTIADQSAQIKANAAGIEANGEALAKAQAGYDAIAPESVVKSVNGETATANGVTLPIGINLLTGSTAVVTESSNTLNNHMLVTGAKVANGLSHAAFGLKAGSVVTVSYDYNLVADTDGNAAVKHLDMQWEKYPYAMFSNGNGKYVISHLPYSGTTSVSPNQFDADGVVSPDLNGAGTGRIFVTITLSEAVATAFAQDTTATSMALYRRTDEIQGTLTLTNFMFSLGGPAPYTPAAIATVGGQAPNAQGDILMDAYLLKNDLNSSLASREYIPANSDLDMYTSAGNFQQINDSAVAATKNVPFGTMSYFLDVLVANGYFVQVAYSYQGDRIATRGGTVVTGPFTDEWTLYAKKTEFDVLNNTVKDLQSQISGGGAQPD